MARYVYLGTPEAAVPPLRTLVRDGHDVALVVSRPDKRRSRGTTLLPSPVKAAAAELGLPVTDSLDDVAAARAELGVVVAYGRIIPSALLERLPMVNLHFSLLPRWRGAAPVERALLEGDAETGVCLMAVETGLDTGPVYAETATSIGDDERVGELRDRLVGIGCALVSEHLAGGWAGLPVPHEQSGTPTYAEKILPDDLRIDWCGDARSVRRLVRLERAWTTFRGKRLAIRRVAGAGGGDGEGPAPAGPGVLAGEVVGTGGGGRVRLLEVQPEGRRSMAADDWLRGVRPGPGEHLGD